MHKAAISFGAFLIVLGIVSYLLTGQASVTALIPSFFGLGLVLTGWIARNDDLRKHAMHAAAVIALLGVLGSLGRGVPALMSGSTGIAVVMQLVMGLSLLIFLILCVRSFIEARRGGA